MPELPFPSPKNAACHRVRKKKRERGKIWSGVCAERVGLNLSTLPPKRYLQEGTVVPGVPIGADPQFWPQRVRGLCSKMRLRCLGLRKPFCGKRNRDTDRQAAMKEQPP